MNRILSVAIVLLVAMSASAADRFARDPDTDQISMATTGRIVKIDAKNKTFKVRASDSQSLSIWNVPQSLSQMLQGLKQRIGVTLPGGITIALPGRGGKIASKPAQTPRNNVEEYTVVVTENTVFQDGADSINFDDFRTGETVSIHGVLNGSTLTASRIAKWF